MCPAVDSVTFAEAPGEMKPVANDLLSAVASWVVVSLFVKVTTVPTGTVIGLGANAVVVSVEAPRTIDTAIGVGDVGVVGVVGVVGAVGVEGDEESLPQPPAASTDASATAMNVRDL